MQPQNTKLAFLVAGVMALAGCGGDGGTSPGAIIALDKTTFSFTALGQNHQFSVVDGTGKPITANLTWSTSDPAIVQVNAGGLATSIGIGTAVLKVSTARSTASASLTVAPSAAHVVAVLGDRQSGPPSQQLPSPLTVQVTDALNRPVPGVLVHFAPGDAGGAVGIDTATTDRFGLAATTFTLGADSGSYTAIASVPGTALTATFTVQTGGVFTIELMFLSSATPAQTQAFLDAKSRWESAIQGDLPDDYAILPAGACGNSPALDRPIDDLLIFVNITDIDGPGGVLAQAGPCFAHEVGGLPAIGTMTFDVADLDEMENLGLLSSVVTHEMGHVLGYGVLWNNLGLLADPSLEGGLDPHFTGAEAIAAFDAAGGTSYPDGKVPVETQGGPGTADSHWRESVFDNELMTGYVNLGSNPLSAITLASMADVGYVIDQSVADAYTLPLGAARPKGPRIGLRLGNDVVRRPFRVITRNAKIVPPFQK